MQPIDDHGSVQERGRGARRRVALGLALVVTLGVAYGPRIASYLEFRAERPKWHLADGVVPANLDAYTWLRAARDIRAGKWREGEFDRLRRHPDGVRRGSPPWPARAIARVADWTGGDVYGAGVLWSVATSCLFVLPVFLLGVRAGMPAAGMLAGLVGSASPAYLTRSSVQWVDTDSVNLFALCWIVWLSSLPRSDWGRTRAIAGAAAVGLSIAVFVAWYAKPGFVPVLLALFGLRLVAARFAPGRAVLLLAVALVTANPLSWSDALPHLGRFMRGAAGYLWTPGSSRDHPASRGRAPAPVDVPARVSPLQLGDISSSISENKRLPLARALEFTLVPHWLAAIGLLAFAAWAGTAWRVAIAWAPLAALGAYGVVGPSRHLMYLAPLVGFGLGAGLTSIARVAAARAGRPRAAPSLACLLALAAHAALLVVRGPLEPSPSIGVPLLASMQRAGRILPDGASVWCTWGEGFAVQDVMHAATWNDSVPDPVRGHLFDKGMTSADPRLLQRVIAYLESHSRQDAQAAFRGNYVAALDELLGGSGAVRGAPYIWIARPWLGQFGVMHRHGQWHPERGWPRPAYIVRLGCRASGPARLDCRDLGGRLERIDLRTGRVEDGQPYGRLVLTRNGRFEHERYFGNRSRWVLVVDRTGRRLSVVAADRRALASNLAQLFLLGRVDPRYFELVYDDYPRARLYRVKSDAGPAAGAPPSRDRATSASSVDSTRSRASSPDPSGWVSLGLLPRLGSHVDGRLGGGDRKLQSDAAPALAELLREAIVQDHMIVSTAALPIPALGRTDLVEHHALSDGEVPHP